MHEQIALQLKSKHKNQHLKCLQQQPSKHPIYFSILVLKDRLCLNLMEQSLKVNKCCFDV